MRRHQPADAAGHPPARSGRDYTPGEWRATHNMSQVWWQAVKEQHFLHRWGVCFSLTCTELVIVLRANTVAQSFMVDWLSNAPWVSTRRTATCWMRGHDSGRCICAAQHSYKIFLKAPAVINILPCCHQTCWPQRPRSRPGFPWSPSHSLLASWIQ